MAATDTIVIDVAARRFQPTNRGAEKRTERIVMLFTASELEWIAREAARQNTSVHNFIRAALAKLSPRRKDEA